VEIIPKHKRSFPRGKPMYMLSTNDEADFH